MQFFKTNYLYFLLPLLAMMVIRLFFGIDGLYGQDAYEYLRFTKEISAFWSGGSLPHDFFWPVGYPFVASWFAVITGSSGLALQLVSVLALSGTLVYLHRILRLTSEKDNVITLYLTVFIFLSPLVFRSSMICMSDMLCAFFVIAHIYHYLKYKASSGAIDLFLLVFFAGCAVFTRYGSAVIVSVTCGLAFISFMRNFRWVYVAAGLIGVVLAVMPHVLFTQNGFFHFTGHQWLSHWEMRNVFSSSFVTNDGNTIYALPNFLFYLIDICHPRFFIPLIPLVIFAFVKKVSFPHLWLLIPVLIYVLFLSGMPTQNTRFLLPVVPVLAVICFPAFQRMLVTLPYKVPAIVAVVVLQMVLVRVGFESLYARIKFEQQVLNVLNTKYAGRNLYSFDLEVAMRGRGYKGKVYSLFDSVYSGFEKQDIILFNENRFKIQWTNRPPMQNWENLKLNYQLEKRESLQDGWEVYEVR